MQCESLVHDGLLAMLSLCNWTSICCLELLLAPQVPCGNVRKGLVLNVLCQSCLHQQPSEE